MRRASRGTPKHTVTEVNRMTTKAYFNQTTDGVYAFDFIAWSTMQRAAERTGADPSSLRFDYPADQDLLIVMQPAGPSGEYYELGYVTPDQLRDALRLAGLLPEPVEEGLRC